MITILCWTFSHLQEMITKELQQHLPSWLVKGFDLCHEIDQRLWPLILFFQSSLHLLSLSLSSFLSHVLLEPVCQLYLWSTQCYPTCPLSSPCDDVPSDAAPQLHQLALGWTLWGRSHWWGSGRAARCWSWGRSPSRASSWSGCWGGGKQASLVSGEPSAAQQAVCGWECSQRYCTCWKGNTVSFVDFHCTFVVS